jgi:hypothetical protein
VRIDKLSLLLIWWRVLGIVAISIGVAGNAEALSYSAKPITAQVVDADTKEPLADVIVLVLWELEDIGGGSGGILRFEETVGDQRGHFTFAGWGPQTVPPSDDGRLWRLDTEQPILYLFKFGYRLKAVTNYLEMRWLGNPTWTGDPVRASEWNGKQIELQRFEGADHLYVRALSRSASRMPLQECRWAQIPRMTAALMKARAIATEQREFINSLPTMRSLETKAADYGCPNPRELLAPYLK